MGATAPSGRDLRRVLAWTGELLELSEDDEIPQRLLRGASEVVGSDTATVTHVDVHTGQEVAVLWPPDRAAIARVGAYAELGHTHPLRTPALTATAERGRVRPVRISDVLSRPAWRRSALHVEAMRDISDQLTLPLSRRGGALHALTLGRHSGTFTDRQREVLELVAEGLTDAQVARRLGLRPATVSRHLHRLYRRNGVTNRAAAVLLLTN